MNKKEKIKFIILVSVIASIVSSVSVYASNYFYTGNDIGYDNSESGLDADNVQGALDDLREKATDYNEIREEIDKIKSDLAKTKAEIQPVGSIYMSITDDTVAKVQAKFGGTWVKIEGRFLLSSSGSYAVNATGGSADAVVVSHSHTFTGTRALTEGGGSHTHTLQIRSQEGKVYTAQYGAYFQQGTNRGGINWGNSTTNGAPLMTTASNHQHYYTPSGTVKSSGASGAGKNMPPYYVVHVYKRTA